MEMSRIVMTALVIVALMGVAFSQENATSTPTDQTSTEPAQPTTAPGSVVISSPSLARAILASDVCGNGIGYSEGFDPNEDHVRKWGTRDPCNWYVPTHVHDLGQAFDADLLVEYKPGFTEGCGADVDIAVSTDGSAWRTVRKSFVNSHYLGNNWQSFYETIDGVSGVRYVRVSIPNCYNDYSKVDAYSSSAQVNQTLVGITIASVWTDKPTYNAGDTVLVYAKVVDLDGTPAEPGEGTSVSFFVFPAEQAGKPMPVSAPYSPMSYNPSTGYWEGRAGAPSQHGAYFAHVSAGKLAGSTTFHAEGRTFFSVSEAGGIVQRVRLNEQFSLSPRDAAEVVDYNSMRIKAVEITPMACIAVVGAQCPDYSVTLDVSIPGSGIGTVFQLYDGQSTEVFGATIRAIDVSAGFASLIVTAGTSSIKDVYLGQKFDLGQSESARVVDHRGMLVTLNSIEQIYCITTPCPGPRASLTVSMPVPYEQPEEPAYGVTTREAQAETIVVGGSTAGGIARPSVVPVRQQHLSLGVGEEARVFGATIKALDIGNRATFVVTREARDHTAPSVKIVPDAQVARPGDTVHYTIFLKDNRQSGGPFEYVVGTQGLPFYSVLEGTSSLITLNPGELRKIDLVVYTGPSPVTVISEPVQQTEAVNVTAAGIITMQRGYRLFASHQGLSAVVSASQQPGNPAAVWIDAKAVDSDGTPAEPGEGTSVNYVVSAAEPISGLGGSVAPVGFVFASGQLTYVPESGVWRVGYGSNQPGRYSVTVTATKAGATASDTTTFVLAAGNTGGAGDIDIGTETGGGAGGGGVGGSVGGGAAEPMPLPATPPGYEGEYVFTVIVHTNVAPPELLASANARLLVKQQGFGQSIRLTRGWNLVSVPGIGAGFSLSTCDTGRKPIAFVRSEGRYLTVQQARQQLGGAFDRFLAGSAFWVYAYNDCTLEYNIQEYVNADAVSLRPGWNFVPVTRDMIGNNLASLAGDCDVQRVYAFDAGSQGWARLSPDSVFSESDFGRGLLVKAGGACTLGLSTVSPPPLPED